MKSVHQIILAAAVAAGSLGAHAQTPAPAPAAAVPAAAVPTKADMEKALQMATIQRAQSAARLTQARDEILRLDASIEKQVNELVSTLKGVTDSTESGTKVANTKESMIQGLRRAVDWYVRERTERLARLKSDPAANQAQINKEIGTLDDRIDRRVDEMLALSASLAKHRDFQKYETHYDSYTGQEHKEIRDDYKQSKRAGSKGGEIKEDIGEQLEAAIKQLEQKRTALDQQLRAAATPERRAPIEAEIAWVDERLAERRADFKRLISQPEPGAEAISSKEATQVDRMLQAQALRIRADWMQMQAMENQYSTEQMRVRQFDSQIALIKRKLEQTP